jgi:hypothetical protein
MHVLTFWRQPRKASWDEGCIQLPNANSREVFNVHTFLRSNPHRASINFELPFLIIIEVFISGHLDQSFFLMLLYADTFQAALNIEPELLS